MKKLNYLSLLKYKFSAIILLICCYSCSENGINIIEPPEPPNVCLICPSITSVSPSEGYEGDTIVITGNNLGGATKVLFNNDLEATILGTSTDNEVKVKVPNVNASTPDTVLINVQKLDGKGALLNTNKKGNFKYLMASISQIVPSSAFQGDTVELKGQKLDQIQNISFDNIESPVFIINNRYLTRVPGFVTTNAAEISGKQRNGKGVLTGSALSFKYLYPTITTLTPNEAFEGDTVQLTGQRLDLIHQIELGNKKVNVIANSGNEKIYKIIIPSVSGNNVTEVSVDGTNTSLQRYPVANAKLKVLNEHITGFTPNEGAGNATVKIFGKFNLKKFTPKVSIANTNCELLSTSTKDSLIIKTPKPGKSGVFTVNSGKNLVSENKFYYIPNSLTAELIDPLKISKFPKMNSVSITKIVTSPNFLILSFFDKDSSFFRILEINKAPRLQKGEPEMYVETNHSLKTNNSDYTMLFDIATAGRFIYLLRGSGNPSNTLLAQSKWISRIDKTTNILNANYRKLNNDHRNFDCDLEQNIYMIPGNEQMIKYDAGMDPVILTSTLFQNTVEGQLAGIASGLDQTIFYSNKKLYSIDHATYKLNTSLLYENPNNYKIKNLSVNKSAKTERLIFQVDNSQIAIYNVETKKPAKIYTIGVEFDAMCVDENNVIYGVNKNGIYKCVEI